MQQDTGDRPSARAIFRVVAIVVISALSLVALYLLREPLGYIVLALFIAVCASGPIGALSRYIGRGKALAVVYLLIVLVPLIILVILIRPLVRQLVALVENLPEYIREAETAFAENEQLRKLNEEYNITEKLEQLAKDLAASLDDAALALADVGAGLVNSVFALVTILVLSMFMVSSGRRWIETFLLYRPEHEARALRRAFDGMATAVGGYVGGALLQATVAGMAAFLMLVILGIPSPLPLALIIAILDLIPLVGATIGAVIVGVVVLIGGGWGDVLIWALFAIAYQQFENYVVQPRIQSKAVNLDPFIVVVAAICGAALLGIAGALLAIPAAATIQVGIREYMNFRRETGRSPPRPEPQAPAEPAAS